MQPGATVAPYTARAGGRAYRAAHAALADAWGDARRRHRRRRVHRGSSPPSPSAFPDAEILITGVEDPDTRAHGANESLHLAVFERACLAEALLLRNLAETS